MRTERYIIFPIVWEWPSGGLHKALLPFQNRQEGFPKAYAENGLNAIIRLRRERDFQSVLITLAGQIRDAFNESSLPDWPTLPPVDDIESVFHAGSRYQYGVAFLQPKSADWRPFANGPGLYELCAGVSAQTGRLCRPLVAEADLVSRLKQSLSNREAFVVVTDLDSAVGSHKDLLAELNDAELANVAVFVVPSGAMQEERTKAVESLRASYGNLFNQALPHNWLGIKSANSLSNLLVDALVRVGAELIKADPAEKVSDDEITRKAFESGIRTESAPVLSGPGRRA